MAATSGGNVLRKLILLSVLAGTFAAPLLASRDPSARRGLKRLALLTVGFNLLYLAAVLWLYHRV